MDGRTDSHFCLEIFKKRRTFFCLFSGAVLLAFVSHPAKLLCWQFIFDETAAQKIIFSPSLIYSKERVKNCNRWKVIELMKTRPGHLRFQDAHQKWWSTASFAPPEATSVYVRIDRMMYTYSTIYCIQYSRQRGERGNFLPCVTLMNASLRPRQGVISEGRRKRKSWSGKSGRRRDRKKQVEIHTLVLYSSFVSTRVKSWFKRNLIPWVKTNNVAVSYVPVLAQIGVLLFPSRHSAKEGTKTWKPPDNFSTDAALFT